MRGISSPSSRRFVSAPQNHRHASWRRPDRDPPDRPGPRALPGFRERCFTEAERAYRDSKPNPPQHYAARFAGKEAVGKALRSGVRFTWREIEIAGRPKPGVTLTGKTKAWPSAWARVRSALDDALEGTRPGGVCRLPMLESIYTADEMKAAEAGHDVKELMARAGRPSPRRRCGFPGGPAIRCRLRQGANGGDGRIALEVLEAAGRAARPVEDAPLDDADVIIDALFGTGFHGDPREDAARTIEAINAATAPVVSVDLPSGVDSSTGEVPAPASRPP